MEKHTDLTAHLSASTPPFGQAGRMGLDTQERDYSESEIIMNISVSYFCLKERKLVSLAYEIRCHGQKMLCVIVQMKTRTGASHPDANSLEPRR